MPTFKKYSLFKIDHGSDVYKVSTWKQRQLFTGRPIGNFLRYFKEDTSNNRKYFPWKLLEKEEEDKKNRGQ
ncbi:hypothetical protein H8356DRAFT_1322158 [Neocallimastix lanati (nom. inval.)]|nr:hypothetical protein H8356DRAFT_1322158 [Neocallimastix sp. JGI-2020a]